MPTDAKPTFYAYVRVSTGDQSTSIAVQEEAVTACWKARFATTHAWGGIWADENVSGKIEFKKRPQGALLHLRMKAGDVLGIKRLDRGFRSQADLYLSIATWAERKIGLISADDALIDTTTPAGKFVIQILGAAAEFERALISERTREALQMRKSMGLAINKPAIGWTVGGVKGKRKYVPYMIEREVMKLIYSLRMTGLTFKQIFKKLRDDGVMNTKTKKKQRWGIDKITWAYYSEAYRIKNGLAEPPQRRIRPADLLDGGTTEDGPASG